MQNLLDKSAKIYKDLTDRNIYYLRTKGNI